MNSSTVSFVGSTPTVSGVFGLSRRFELLLDHADPLQPVGPLVPGGPAARPHLQSPTRRAMRFVGP